MATIDQKQQRTAHWLVDQVLKAAPNRDAVWNLTGAVGSGKTSVLRLVAESLRQTSLIPVLVTAPAGEVDAAPIALFEAASHLKRAALLNGESDILTDPRHHGSREAIHDVVGDGPATRCWIVTPFRRQGLPRAEDVSATPPHESEGLAKILSFVSRVHLTSLPFSHECEHYHPCVATRQSIRDRRYPPRTQGTGVGITATIDALERQVMVAFDGTGQVRDILYGKGSALVS